MTKKKSRKEQRQAEVAARARRQRNRYLIIGGVALALLLVLVGVGVFRSETAPGVDEAINPANIDGDPAAPVQVVEFGDFGCPSCRAWHNSGIKAQLKEEFGDQVAFTFRHFPVITALSPGAAEAGQCAAEQGRFWDYHDFIYERTQPGALGSDALISYAGALGLDAAAFSACFENGRYRDYVANDMRAARAAGARGTPTFFVNGVQTSPTLASMRAAIEEALP